MTMSAQPALRLKSVDADLFAADVVAGLRANPKRLSPKYFYDATGSELFERITLLPEYYPTRTELQILGDYADEIVAFAPPDAALIEFGSGSATKVRILLRASPRLTVYVPVDISGEFLNAQAKRLQQEFPEVAVVPVAADFSRPFNLPRRAFSRPRIGFFPGSTIGNLEPQEAISFLCHGARILGPGATLIIGVDLVKDPAILHKAYNDSAGVTAKFNLNLIARINRELDADFDLQAFEHLAFYNEDRQRIEMHLVSRLDQKVDIAGTIIEFSAGETIHTENSYKYTIDGFAALAEGAGWSSGAVWTDSARLFSVHALTR